MRSPRKILDSLWENVRTPRVSDQQIEACLRRARRNLPEPVFWLLGKSQSGKTAIIRALTGSTRAEIGDGFRPCTRTAQLYAFPGEERPFLRFLDTRGLGEADYDPAEDVRLLQRHAHCVVAVMRAMDHAQGCVLRPLESILAAHPEWPLIVVQTCLHEGYPAGQTEHVIDYPFQASPLPPSVPHDLARSLLAQREWFRRHNARFVPVDFTLPEDRFEPEHYGLDALWAAVEDAVPLGLRAMLQETTGARRELRDVHRRLAQEHVLNYSVAAGVAAGVPVPMVDFPLVVAIQARMFHALARIYRQKLNSRRVAEISSTLGAGLLTRLGMREVLKVVPGLGSTVSALYAAASTYALGRTLCVYFSHALDGDLPEPEVLRGLYQREFEEGRQRLGEYLKHVLRRRKGKP